MTANEWADALSFGIWVIVVTSLILFVAWEPLKRMETWLEQRLRNTEQGGEE